MCTLFVQENQVEGDPELVEDAEFYQQLLKEFFETIDPASSGIVKKKNMLELLDMKCLSDCSCFWLSEFSVLVYCRGGFLRYEEISDEKEENCGSACLQVQKDQVFETHFISLWIGFVSRKLSFAFSELLCEKKTKQV